MPLPEKKPVSFPYKSLETATRDSFKKIGGPDRAWAYLIKGFKSAAWRKRTDAAARVRDEAEGGGGD